MPTLNIKQGESLRLAVQIDGVDISTLTNVEIAINRISYTLSSEEITQDPSDDSIFILSLSSATTNNFFGKYPVYLSIDSNTLGVQKSGELLTLNFQIAAPLTSPSTTTTIDAFITATIDTDAIIADATIAQIMKGDTGAQGPAGAQGPQGLKGDKGDKGDQGEPGTAVNAITSLNNLTATVQTFAIGSAGNDVNIVSSGGVHTFNFPDAGAASRGFMNAQAQSIQGAKSFLAELNTRKQIATGLGTTSATVAREDRNSAGIVLLQVLDDGTNRLSPNIGVVNIGNGQLQIVAFSNTALLNSAGNWRITTGSDEVFAYGSFYKNISFFDGFTAAGANLGGSRILCLKSGTAPTNSLADNVLIYSADIAPGKAALHLRTEDGKVIKLYCQDNTTTAATLVANSGTAINSASTFDGYTMAQVVKALRNAGFLQ